MLDRTRHRGPHGRCVWSRPDVALRHVRLNIDLSSGGAQPMLGANGRHRFVFNGDFMDQPRTAQLAQRFFARHLEHFAPRNLAAKILLR